jgi:hypothetical protein
MPSACKGGGVKRMSVPLGVKAYAQKKNEIGTLICKLGEMLNP